MSNGIASKNNQRIAKDEITNNLEHQGHKHNIKHQGQNIKHLGSPTNHICAEKWSTKETDEH